MVEIKMKKGDKMKLWNASLDLSVSHDKNSEFKYQTYFEVEECEGDFELIEERKEFFHSERSYTIRIPSVMREEFDSYNVIKIVQGFDKVTTEI